MIYQLQGLINEFKGPESHTHCFTHILNLIAKSIIQQFDIPRAQANSIFDEATMALIELAGNINVKEQKMAKSSDNSDNDKDDKNTEDWVNERDSMTAEQLTALDRSVQPVRLMLVKVRIESKLYIIDHNSPHTFQLRKTAFAIKNSSTIILPCWYEILKELELSAHMMPWDVST
jgi:hypothetical protein